MDSYLTASGAVCADGVGARTVHVGLSGTATLRTVHDLRHRFGLRTVHGQSLAQLGTIGDSLPDVLQEIVRRWGVAADDALTTGWPLVVPPVHPGMAGREKDRWSRVIVPNALSGAPADAGVW